MLILVGNSNNLFFYSSVYPTDDSTYTVTGTPLQKITSLLRST